MSSIGRRAHILRREKTLAMPREIIFYDTETTQTRMYGGSIRQDLKMGWACYYRRPYGRHVARFEWFYFETALAFWQFVFGHTTRKKKLWVISHNLNFDFTIVNGWHYLRQVGFKLKFLHNTGVTCIISVRSQHGSIIFVDFMNWFPEALAKIGARIGIPKIKIDFVSCTDSELSMYCKRDVEILLGGFKDYVRFLETNKISRLCYTRASTAMAAYLLNYYDYKIYIHNNAEAIDLERQAYSGGRTEAFYLGELNDETYYCLDVNSLYPCVMYNCCYPVKYKRIVDTISIRSLSEQLGSLSCIAQVLIDTDEPAYAVKRERTIFPVGRFWAVLCTPELLYAARHNHIVKVGRAVFYDNARIFERYVKRFYELRQQFKSAGQDSYEQFCKYFLNSLYGKFGQKAEVWTKIGECPGQPDRTEMVCYPGQNRRGLIRYLLGDIFELTGFEESFNSFPAVSAHVTAYGRMYLYSLMKKAGAGNYFYCDTDSLIVNEAGLCNLTDLLSDTNLGCLKVEERTSSIIIRGLKDYLTGTKQVVKGIRGNAIELEEGVYQQEVWPTLKGLLSAGSCDTYTVRQTVKHLNRRYTKGTVNPDGVISPLALADSDSPSLWQQPL